MNQQFTFTIKRTLFDENYNPSENMNRHGFNRHPRVI
ncbi:Uncharacterised protein [Klebsiella michiganensis]|nr:Uncharacterised protein [Klebsiella michiganensis]